MRTPSHWPVWIRSATGKLWHAKFIDGQKVTYLCGRGRTIKADQIWTSRIPVVLINQERLCDDCSQELRDQVYEEWYRNHLTTY